MTNPVTASQALERAKGLLSDLVHQYQAPGAKAIGSTQLRNMLIHVENIEARLTSTDQHPANAIKRLRDFSKTIERLQTPADVGGPLSKICHELATSLRLAADLLVADSAQPVAA